TRFFASERHAKGMLAGREFLRDELLLRFEAEEVVHVMQLSILDEQHVAAEARAMSEDHAVRVGGEVHVGDDLVRAATDVRRDAFRYARRTWEVDVACAWRLRFRMLDGK